MTAGPREIPEGEEILRRFEPLVRATARRYAGRGADYDDLVQAPIPDTIMLLLAQLEAKETEGGQ